MQILKSVIFTVLLMSLATVTMAADVEQHDGPYGLTALVIEREGRKMLAWKLPNDQAQLLFLGSIYDGEQDITWKYARKLLGPNRLKTDASGIRMGNGKAEPLWIFYDPSCETCKLLYEKISSQPFPDSVLVWVPITLEDDESANHQGAQWVMSAMPEARRKWSLFDTLTTDEKAMGMMTYQDVVKYNYQLLKWLKGKRESEISVPTFAWINANGVQIENNMKQGRLEEVIKALKKGVK